jgi:hypothetical protein
MLTYFVCDTLMHDERDVQCALLRTMLRTLYFAG